METNNPMISLPAKPTREQKLRKAIMVYITNPKGYSKGFMVLLSLEVERLYNSFSEEQQKAARERTAFGIPDTTEFYKARNLPGPVKVCWTPVVTKWEEVPNGVVLYIEIATGL